MSQPTILELCAGYNGLGMAVEEVFGARTVAFSEYDTAPSKVLAHHYPDVPNYGDMTKIDWAAIEQVDIISGGTPCQDLSAAGRRAGMNEGTRSNLWVQMREAIAIQKPKWVVWENVRGAFSACASSEMGQCQGCVDGRGPHKPFLRALGRVLGDLSDLGYDTQWRGLRAADVGGCHGRFRVFVLGRLRDVGVPRYANVADVERRRAAGWANADPQQGSRADRSTGDGHRTAPTSYRDRFGHERPRDSRGRWTRLEDGRLVVPNATGLGWGKGWAEPEGLERRFDAPLNSCPAPTDAGHSAGNGERSRSESRQGIEDASDDPSAARQSPESGHLYTPTGSAAELGKLTSAVAWGEYEPAIRRWERTIGRRAPRPTEPTGRNNGHRLSPRFTEWMMGLPDGWVTDPAIGISRNEQLKACGNGVVPQQAIAALSDMLAAFNRLEAAA